MPALACLCAGSSRPWLNLENFQQTHSTVGLGSCWYLDLLQRSRVQAPGRVRFTLPPKVVVDAHTVSAPDSAYWVSKLVPRPGASTSSIDVSSGQLPQRTLVKQEDVVENNYVEGRDYCGPNSGALTRESWKRTGRTSAWRRRLTATPSAPPSWACPRSTSTPRA